MSAETKRSYQTWSLEEDLKLFSYVKQAKARRLPLTRLFAEVAQEFERKPQTIAQHYYSEVRPREDEYASIVQNHEDPAPVNQESSSKTHMADNGIGFPKEGAIVEGTVENIVPFGVFIRLDNDIKGLLHISQISREFIEDLHDIFHVNQRVRVRVESIDENGRLSFSTIGMELPNKEKKTPLITEKVWQSEPSHEGGSTRVLPEVYYELLNDYCYLQNELRKFQTRVIRLEQKLSLIKQKGRIVTEIESFISKCLEL